MRLVAAGLIALTVLSATVIALLLTLLLSR
jgi:hypothetical protein